MSAEAARPIKILVAGSVQGRFNALFQRVETVNKSAAGPFDLLLCVGDFFGQGEDSNDELKPFLNGTRKGTPAAAWRTTC